MVRMTAKSIKSNHLIWALLEAISPTLFATLEAAVCLNALSPTPVCITSSSLFNNRLLDDSKRVITLLSSVGISVMSGIEIHHCRPQQGFNKAQTYQLSEVDRIAVPALVPFFLVFPLTDSTPARRADIVSTLIRGLEKTLSQFPLVLGRVHRDEASQKLFIHRRGSEDSVQLTVKGLQDVSVDLPSFEDLEKVQFEPAAFPSGDLLPLEEYNPHTQSRSDSDEPCYLFQVNFIRGGLILASSMNHLVVDGPSHDRFQQHWALNSREPNNTKQADVSLDRSVLTCQTEVPESRTAALKEKLDAECGAALKLLRMPTAEDMKAKVLAKLIHFPESKCRELKSEISSQAQERVSTIDCINALIWRCTTRARMPLRKPTADSLSCFYYGVGFRGRPGVKIPSNYFGNAVMILRGGPLSVETILGEHALPELASSIRRAVRAVDQDFVNDLVEWSGNVKHGPDTRIMVNSHLSMDILVSSWADADPYVSMDFGFGLPKAYSAPNAHTEVSIIWPKRADGNDEGLIVNVALEEGCLERFLNDPELLRFAERRGT